MVPGGTTPTMVPGVLHPPWYTLYYTTLGTPWYTYHRTPLGTPSSGCDGVSAQSAWAHV